MITNARTEERERLLTFGIWLIGLGSVFLIKQGMGWGWSEAWPLFVILLGVGGLLSALVRRRRSSLGMWGIGWPIALTVAGSVLLASTTGSIDLSLSELLGWWPLLVLGLGVWFVLAAVMVRETGVRSEALAIPLGDLAQAEIRLDFGGGELTIGQAQPGMLLSGHFGGGVIQRVRGEGRFELRPSDSELQFLGGRVLRWEVGITPDIPVDLRIDSGANRSRLDLSALRIRRLELHTGASETHVRLPAAGQTTVRVEVGVAAVTLDVPPGVAARVKGKLALGSTAVDEARFPRSAEGWASPDYETAVNRMDIEVEGGLGSVKVT